MALIVETGAGLADAESYVSIEDCASYAAARGLTFPASPADIAEAALRRATAYIDARYGARFDGCRVHARLQALAWPRTGAIDAEGNIVPSDEVPIEIVHATCEAAVLEFAEPGSLAPTIERGVKRLKAGPVEIEYGGAGQALSVFPAIDNALAGLLRRGGIYTARAARA